MLLGVVKQEKNNNSCEFAAPTLVYPVLAAPHRLPCLAQCLRRPPQGRKIRGSILACSVIIFLGQGIAVT